MTYSDHVEVIKSLKAQTRRVTDHQRQLAEVAGERLATRTPTLVAAAKLREWLANELALSAGREIPDWLHELLEGASASSGICPTPKPETRDQAEAWLAHIRLKSRMKEHQRLRLKHGDLVKVRTDSLDDIFVVSSISNDGSVWFQGGFGARAWPDQVEKLTSTTPEEDTDFRRAAANRSAGLRRPAFSAAAAAELKKYKAQRPVARELLDGLRATIDKAEDKRPIQAYLARHRDILGLLMRGPEAYVIGERRLGAEYVPDFLLADVDSNGPRWVLVELETPNSAVVLKTVNDFDKNARKGVSQVHEWRQWIEDNLDYARRLGSHSGRGLAGIRPAADGLVLVGRRRLEYEHAAPVKRRPWDESRIMVHTYDWLLEQLEGSAGGIDSPVYNPFILPRRS